MPVGPLSLSDEVALDLGLKVIKATETDLGPNSINPDQKKLMVELVEKQGRLGRKNSKGFYDYPEKGKGQKSLWPGLSALQPRARENSSSSATSWRPNTARASPRRNCWKTWRRGTRPSTAASRRRRRRRSGRNSQPRHCEERQRRSNPSTRYAAIWIASLRSQ
jgi:3-hydroxyacyl-CoA dehydrogenase